MAGAAAQAKMALLLAAGAAIFLLVDDLQAFLSGDRHSAIELLFGSPKEAQEVRAMMIAVGTELKATFVQLGPALKELGKALWDLFSMLWKDVVKPLLPYLVTGLRWLVKGLTVWIGLMVKLFTYALVKPLQWLIPWVTKAVTWLAKILGPVFAPVVAVVKWLFDAVIWGVEKLSAAWRWIADTIGGFISGIAEWFRSMWDGLVGWLEKAWQALAAPFRWAAEQARKAWGYVIEKIKEAYSWAVKTLRKSASWAVKTLRKSASWAVKTLRKSAEAVGGLLPEMPEGFSPAPVPVEGPAPAMPIPGGQSRTNNVSVNNLTLALSNPTSMTPEQLTRMTAEGLIAALRDVLARTNDHRM
jgi:hypothetical protein